MPWCGQSDSERQTTLRYQMGALIPVMYDSYQSISDQNTYIELFLMTTGAHLSSIVRFADQRVTGTDFVFNPFEPQKNLNGKRPCVLCVTCASQNWLNISYIFNIMVLQLSQMIRHVKQAYDPLDVGHIKWPIRGQDLCRSVWNWWEGLLTWWHSLVMN